jgi:hypothetical protein
MAIWPSGVWDTPPWSVSDAKPGDWILYITWFNPMGIVIWRPSWEITRVFAGVGVAVEAGVAVGDVATGEGVGDVREFEEVVAVPHPARATMPMPAMIPRLGLMFRSPVGEYRGG